MNFHIRNRASQIDTDIFLKMYKPRKHALYFHKLSNTFREFLRVFKIFYAYNIESIKTYPIKTRKTPNVCHI